MICVGIDVAKDKHDCFIVNSEGEILMDLLTIANNRDGFETLLQKIRSFRDGQIKVGLERSEEHTSELQSR